MNSKIEDLLKTALATGPVPEPSDGFVDRVLANAINAQPQRRWHTRWVAAASVAMAASVALALILTATTGQRDAVPMEALQATHHGHAGPRIINVVISASDRREYATLTIRLADDLELDGYEGLSVISWQTDLEQGRNLLALPVRSKIGRGGEIWIALAYSGSVETELRIQVDAG